jgi:hypothetical protein
MIFCFTALVAVILYGLFAEYSPVLAWRLTGLAAVLGGIWAGIDQRMNS